jgi:bacterial leucyl aminopeptidase
VTAFVRDDKPKIIGLFKDVVDPELTEFVQKLVEAYTPLPWNMTGCGARCGSDHMSWTKAGYPAVFATEGLFEGGHASGSIGGGMADEMIRRTYDNDSH